MFREQRGERFSELRVIETHELRLFRKSHTAVVFGSRLQQLVLHCGDVVIWNRVRITFFNKSD